MSDRIEAHDPTDRLVVTLKAVRDRHASEAESSRRDALRKALDESLESVPRDQVPALLERTRERLVREAREREAGKEALERQVTELEAKVTALEAENQRLQESRPATVGAGDAAETIVKGLIRSLDGKDAKPDAVGVPEVWQRVYRLMRELQKFTLNVEQARQSVLRVHEVGPQAQMGDRTFVASLDEVRDQLRACLENQEDSVRSFRKVLRRNEAFLVRLNTAYLQAVQHGASALLRKFDPDPILQEHTGAFGVVKFEKAFNELSTRHQDLTQQDADDLWRTYFRDPLRKRLDED